MSRSDSSVALSRKSGLGDDDTFSDGFLDRRVGGSGRRDDEGESSEDGFLDCSSVVLLE